MRLNRTKNTINNIVSGSITKVILLIFPFVVKTIIIRVLGISYLGLSNLFVSIINMLNITELGFSSAIVFCMYKPLAEDNRDMICALIKFYRHIYYVMGTVVLFFGLLLLFFLPYLIKGEYPQGVNIYILYLIYLLNDILGYFLFSYKSCLLIVHQRQDIINLVRLTLCSLQYIVQVFVLLVCKNYYVYIFILPITTISTNIVNAGLVRKMYPQYICKGSLSKAQKKEIWMSVAGLSVNGASGLICTTMDNIIISSFLGLNIVAIYGNYYYVLSMAHSCMFMIMEALRAGIGNSIVSESIEKNYKTMCRIRFIYMWIAGICASCLICLYQPFIDLWVGEEYSFPFSTVVCEVLYFYVLCIKDIERIYCDAIGYWLKAKMRYIVEAVVNITLNVILVSICGVNGVILASVASFALGDFGFGIPYLYKYYFKDRNIKNEYMTYMCYFGIMILACSSSYYICTFLRDGVIGFIEKGVVSFGVSNLIFLLFLSKSDNFEVMIQIIKQIFIKGSNSSL